MTQRKRIASTTGKAIVVLVLLLATVYLVRNPLLTSFVTRYVVPRVEKEIPGLTFSTISFSTDLYSNVRLKDCAFLIEDDSGSLLKGRLPLVDFHFTFRDLFQGWQYALQKGKLNIFGSTLLYQGGMSETNILEIFVLSDMFATSNHIPFITFSDTSLDIVIEQKTYHFDDLAIQGGRQRDNKYNIEISSARFEQRKEEKVERIFKEINSSLLVDAETISLQSLSLENEMLASDFILSKNEKKIDLYGVLHLFQGKTKVNAQLIGNNLSLSFLSQAEEIADVGVAVKTKLPVSGKLDAEGIVQLDITTLTLKKADIDLSMQDLQFPDSPSPPLSASLHISADKENIHISKSRLSVEGAHIEIENILLPVEILYGKNALQILKNTHGQFQFAIDKSDVLLPFVPALVREKYAFLLPKRALGKGSLNNSTLFLDDTSFFTDDFDMQLQNATVGFGDMGNINADWKNIGLSGAWWLTGDLSPLNNFIPDSLQLAGHAQLKGTVSGSLASPLVSFFFRSEDMIVHDVSLAEITLKADVDNQKLHITNCEIRSRVGDHAVIMADIDLQQKMIHDFSLQALIKDINSYPLPSYLQKKIPEHIKLDIMARGPWQEIGAQGLFHIENFGETPTDMKRLLVPFEVKNNEIHVQSAKAHFIDGSVITTSFSLDKRYQLKLSEFDIESKGQQVSLGKTTVFIIEKKSILAEPPLLLSGSMGSFSFEGFLSSDSSSNALANLHFSQGNDVLKYIGFDEKLSLDSADINITYRGTPDSPYFAINGALKNVRDMYTGMTLSGDFDLSFKENNLNIERFYFGDNDNNQIFLHGTVPLSFDDFKLKTGQGPLIIDTNIALGEAQALFHLLPGYISSVKSLNLQSNITGTWQQPFGTFEIKAEHVQPDEKFTFLPPDPFDLSCELQSKTMVLEVKSCQVFSEALVFNIKGKLSGIDAFSNFFDSNKTRRDGEYDLDGSLILADTSWAADKFDILRRVGGRLESSFTLNGPFSKPHIEAAGVLTNGEVRSSLDLPALREIYIEASLSDTDLTMKNARAVIGGETVHGFGSLTVSKNGVQVKDLNVTGNNLLFFRTQGIKVRGNASLNLQDASERPSLRGEIKLTDTKISKNINIITSLLSGITGSSTPKSTHLFSIKEGYLKEAKLHIKLDYENPVIFSNNLIKGKARPNLLVSGTGELPVLTGEIYLDPTRISFPAGKLLIEDGLVSFLESAPERPVIALNGNAKMMGYDITVQAEGPYDDPVITLSSIPPLANEDLLLLILAGKRPPSLSTGETYNESTVAVYLGRGLLTKLFGSESTDDESLLDRLELDVGRNITQQGDLTIEAKYLLSDKFPSNNASLFLTGEKDVWDDYNGGLRLVFKFR